MSPRPSSGIRPCLGVFGRAIGLPSEVYPRQPTILDKLRPLLSQDIFTTDLQYHAEGLYEFGRVDEAKFDGEISWVKLVDHAKYWQFNFTGFNFGDSRVWYLSQWSVIADTGTTLLLLDPEIVKTYYSQTAGAQFNQTVGGWTYPCDTELPAFRIGFDNGYHVTIPGRYMTYTEVEPGSSVCYGGLQSMSWTAFRHPRRHLPESVLRRLRPKEQAGGICGQIPGWPLTAPLGKNLHRCIFRLAFLSRL